MAFINKKTLLPAGIEMGLCLPDKCTPQEVEAFADEALSQASLPFISKYFKSPQEFSPEYNVAFYFATIILGICLILIAASSIFKITRKSKVVGAFQLQKSLNIF